MEQSPQNNNEKKSRKRRLPSFVNLHMFLLLMILLFPILIFWKYIHWRQIIDQEELAKKDIPMVEDTLDLFIPLQTRTADYVDDGVTTIAFFGNNPFADDRDSPDNLVNLIKEQTGAVVYNFSLKDTFMACSFADYYAPNYPLDAYSFYWLTEKLTSDKENAFAFYQEADDYMPSLGLKKPEYSSEVIAELFTVDFDKVDIIVIMYDASDYLSGLGMYNDTDHFDKTCFACSMAAGVVKLQKRFPNARIIVSSPTYAYYRLEDGRYVSSFKFYYKDIQGRDVLSTYMFKEGEYAATHRVSFIDNLFNTITEENAPEYLSDHYHLNVAGRKLVAQRIIDAIYYFDDPQDTAP